MAGSLASDPFFFRRPAGFDPLWAGASRAFRVQAPAVPRSNVLPPVTTMAAPPQPPANWTAEEQRFLRALREAGL